ncbi:MAG: Prephenate and/or arogenate dehydrogenase [Ignavibacteriae bacterium]|nr:MAG: Prephenate and/or arogenate dehydrogenase [Ignavibacteriota bacterium]
MTVGIIGYGRFGRFLSKHMKNYFDVFAYDIKKIKPLPGVTVCNLSSAASKNIVIISVSIRNFKDVLISIKQFLREDSIIIDVCSVKEYPVRLMKKYLPKNVNLLGTHPLFGPDSFKQGSRNNKIILYPIRIKQEYYNIIKKELFKFGLEIIEMTPQKHDKIMAYTQTLLHLTARSFHNIMRREYYSTTTNYDKAIKIFNLLLKDSEELLEDMLKFNRYSEKAKMEFLRYFNK